MKSHVCGCGPKFNIHVDEASRLQQKAKFRYLLTRLYLQMASGKCGKITFAFIISAVSRFPFNKRDV